jgi:hypothetical protein
MIYLKKTPGNLFLHGYNFAAPLQKLKNSKEEHAEFEIEETLVFMD